MHYNTNLKKLIFYYGFLTPLFPGSIIVSIRRVPPYILRSKIKKTLISERVMVYFESTLFEVCTFLKYGKIHSNHIVVSVTV